MIPCAREDHPEHVWPRMGKFSIYACERFCQLCTGEKAKHRYSDAKGVREHVDRHLKRDEFPGLVLEWPLGFAMTYKGPLITKDERDSLTIGVKNESVETTGIKSNGVHKETLDLTESNGTEKALERAPVARTPSNGIKRNRDEELPNNRNGFPPCRDTAGQPSFKDAAGSQEQRGPMSLQTYFGSKAAMRTSTSSVTSESQDTYLVSANGSFTGRMSPETLVPEATTAELVEEEGGEVDEEVDRTETRDCAPLKEVMARLQDQIVGHIEFGIAIGLTAEEVTQVIKDAIRRGLPGVLEEDEERGEGEPEAEGG